MFLPYEYMLVFLPALVFFTRFLMEYTRCDYYHPACRWVTRITAPLLKLVPVRNYQNLNISALIMMLIMAEVFGLAFMNFETLWHLIQLIPVFLIWAVLQFMLYLMFIGAILSWIPSASVAPWSYLFMKLTSPLTAPFDRFIPPVGFISLSFMIAALLMSFVVFNVMPRVVGIVWDLIK
ncbi:YggT family protein [Succinimonas sp.]|uniref:YggT family protein n=1 Tax=Succinimonas sp. TaxID=1936151 RepID=UPI003870D78C